MLTRGNSNRASTSAAPASGAAAAAAAGTAIVAPSVAASPSPAASSIAQLINMRRRPREAFEQASPSAPAPAAAAAAMPAASPRVQSLRARGAAAASASASSAAAAEPAASSAAAAAASDPPPSKRARRGVKIEDAGSSAADASAAGAAAAGASSSAAAAAPGAAMSQHKDALTCVVCMELPPDEIFQCMHGHLLCTTCHRTIVNGARSVCPICRVRLSRDHPNRNRFAEQVKAQMPVPCTQAGCREQVPFSQLQSHLEDTCGFRSMTCMFKPIGCNWRGIANSQAQHQAACESRSWSPRKILQAVQARNEEMEREHKAKRDQLQAHTDLCDMLTKPARDICVRELVIERDHRLNMLTHTFRALDHFWECVLDPPTTAAHAEVKIHLRIVSELRRAMTVELFILAAGVDSKLTPSMRRVTFRRRSTTSDSFSLPFTPEQARDIHAADSFTLRMGFMDMSAGPVSREFNTHNLSPAEQRAREEELAALSDDDDDGDQASLQQEDVEDEESFDRSPALINEEDEEADAESLGEVGGLQDMRDRLDDHEWNDGGEVGGEWQHRGPSSIRADRLAALQREMAQLQAEEEQDMADEADDGYHGTHEHDDAAYDGEEGEGEEEQSASARDDASAQASLADDTPPSEAHEADSEHHDGAEEAEDVDAEVDSDGQSLSPSVVDLGRHMQNHAGHDEDDAEAEEEDGEEEIEEIEEDSFMDDESSSVGASAPAPMPQQAQQAARRQSRYTQ